MSEAPDGGSRGPTARDPVPERLPLGRRGWYVARMVVFGCVFVSQATQLATHRTGDLVRLRAAVLVAAGVFLVATTVDYLDGRRGL